MTPDGGRRRDSGDGRTGERPDTRSGDDGEGDDGDGDDRRPAARLTEGRRTLIAVGLVAAVLAVVVAVGLATLTGSHLAPAANLTVADAEDSYDFRQTGRRDVVTIRHVGGDALALERLRIRVGGRIDGLEFRAATNWTARSQSLTFRVVRDDRPLGGDARRRPFQSGDALSVAKTAGTFPSNPTATLYVEVFHGPSRTQLVGDSVVVE